LECPISDASGELLAIDHDLNFNITALAVVPSARQPAAPPTPTTQTRAPPKLPILVKKQHSDANNGPVEVMEVLGDDEKNVASANSALSVPQSTARSVNSSAAKLTKPNADDLDEIEILSPAKSFAPSTTTAPFSPFVGSKNNSHNSNNNSNSSNSTSSAPPAQLPFFSKIANKPNEGESPLATPTKLPVRTPPTTFTYGDSLSSPMVHPYYSNQPYAMPSMPIPSSPLPYPHSPAINRSSNLMTTPTHMMSPMMSPYMQSMSPMVGMGQSMPASPLSMMNYPYPYYPGYQPYSPWGSSFASIESQIGSLSGPGRVDVGTLWVSEVVSEITSASCKEDVASSNSLLLQSQQQQQQQEQQQQSQQSQPVQAGLRCKTKNLENKLLYNAVLCFARELGIVCCLFVCYLFFLLFYFFFFFFFFFFFLFFWKNQHLIDILGDAIAEVVRHEAKHEDEEPNATPPAPRIVTPYHVLLALKAKERFDFLRNDGMGGNEPATNSTNTGPLPEQTSNEMDMDDARNKIDVVETSEFPNFRAVLPDSMNNTHNIRNNETRNALQSSNLSNES
jgi:hypothetical protein